VAYSQICSPLGANLTSVGFPDADRTSDMVETPGLIPPYEAQLLAAATMVANPKTVMSRRCLFNRAPRTRYPEL
jgi:hypothetical protein